MTTQNQPAIALDRWARAEREHGPRALVFAPHPDDDVIGLGAQMLRHCGLVDVVYVSDGAPENPLFFKELGFESRAAYAHARRQEAGRALALAGVGPSHVHELGAKDQGVVRDLPAIIDRILALIAELGPELVFLPPYEGGHPDHDATALAVHVARELFAQVTPQAAPPALLEYACYHDAPASECVIYGQFLPSQTPTREFVLDANERGAKAALFACHASQGAVLRNFKLDRECLRVAPEYDFRLPPGAPFLYDRVDFGLRGAEFLRTASQALTAFAIDGPC